MDSSGRCRQWKDIFDIPLPVKYDDLYFRDRAVVREQYRILQKDLCWYCEADLKESPDKDSVQELEEHPRFRIKETFPRGFFDNPIHLHHDHNTGLTLGAVHAVCNAVLWFVHGQ